MLIEAIKSSANKQKDIVRLYSQAFTTDPTIDWNKVNEAIVTRWSESGLRRIKREAIQ